MNLPQALEKIKSLEKEILIQKKRGDSLWEHFRDNIVNVQMLKVGRIRICKKQSKSIFDHHINSEAHKEWSTLEADNFLKRKEGR